MTTKFKPFDPTTAKNGDVVYISCNEKRPYKYIGPDVVNKDASVIHNDSGYGWDFNVQLRVKVPKKTVWVNVYNDGTAYWHTAKENAANDKRKFSCIVGTYPVEIELV